MAKKSLTRLEKSTKVLSGAKSTVWRYVNTENEFTYNGKMFKISDKEEEYRVVNKAGTVENYTNESMMEEILVVLKQDGFLEFYNQNYDLVEEVFAIGENK